MSEAFKGRATFWTADLRGDPAFFVDRPEGCPTPHRVCSVCHIAHVELFLQPRNCRAIHQAVQAREICIGMPSFHHCPSVIQAAIILRVRNPNAADCRHGREGRMVSEEIKFAPDKHNPLERDAAFPLALVNLAIAESLHDAILNLARQAQHVKRPGHDKILLAVFIPLRVASPVEEVGAVGAERPMAQTFDELEPAAEGRCQPLAALPAGAARLHVQRGHDLEGHTEAPEAARLPENDARVHAVHRALHADGNLRHGRS
mmetsp:Transcript_178157/g.571053  ORF Transcript_178157/g.571053 Transcript_178157/m.571053 type:complete len:260 (-) Transcript_178157:661-1440(-)